jgi:hypothetical protein
VNNKIFISIKGRIFLFSLVFIHFIRRALLCWVYLLDKYRNVTSKWTIASIADVLPYLLCVYCAAVSTVYWILLLFCFTSPPPPSGLHWLHIEGKMPNTFGSPFMFGMLLCCPGFNKFMWISYLPLLHMSYKNGPSSLHSNLRVFSPFFSDVSINQEELSWDWKKEPTIASVLITWWYLKKLG